MVAEPMVVPVVIMSMVMFMIMVVVVVMVVLHGSIPLAGSAMCSNMLVSRPLMWASAAE